MVSPLFLQWVVDQALVTADRDLLLTLALGFALLLLLQTRHLGDARLDADRARRLDQGAGPRQPLRPPHRPAGGVLRERATSAT